MATHTHARPRSTYTSTLLFYNSPYSKKQNKGKAIKKDKIRKIRSTTSALQHMATVQPQQNTTATSPAKKEGRHRIPTCMLAPSLMLRGLKRGGGGCAMQRKTINDAAIIILKKYI